MNSWNAFLRSQQVLSIATADASGPWIANVYFVCDENGAVYFISPDSAKHSTMILLDPNVAFSAVWFDPTNHSNRKSIQGLGECMVVSDVNEIAAAVGMHNKEFPEFSSRITPEWIKTNEYGSKVWKIKPHFIKYWDDELYGEEESKEFVVSRVPVHGLKGL